MWGKTWGHSHCLSGFCGSCCPHFQVIQAPLFTNDYGWITVQCRQTCCSTWSIRERKSSVCGNLFHPPFSRVVFWSTSKLPRTLSCHNGEMQSLMYSRRWSMWLKWPKTALLRCLISSFIDISSDSLVTSLFFTKSYQCPVDVKYPSLVRHMKGLEFRNISFQQCLSTSQKHTRAVTGHAKLGGTSIDTGHQTHHRRGQLGRSSWGFPAEITAT